MLSNLFEKNDLQKFRVSHKMEFRKISIEQVETSNRCESSKVNLQVKPDTNHRVARMCRNKLIVSQSVRKTVGLNMRQAIKEEKGLVVVVVESKMDAMQLRSHRKKKLLVNFNNKNSRGHSPGSDIETIDTLKWSRLTQRKQVRFCWALMMLVAFIISILSELDYFHLGRHGQSSGSSRLVSGAIMKPQGMNRELEKQIVDKILGEGYDKRIRPSGINNKTGQNDGPAVVRVNTLIRSISKIDDVTMEYSVQLSLRQEWVDERLAFNKLASYKNYNINSITLTEQERLWKPDLFFRNEKEGHFHKIIMPNVLLRINGDGAVLYSIRISLVLACPMDLKYYPLDKQNCTIEMASYGYLDDDLKFIWKETNPVQINQPLTLPRFTLETFNTAFCTSRTSTGAYSCLRVDLIFKREFSYYLIQIYIPCCMLVIVSWVSFWLDPNAIPARVSLGVTTLLTMATQISGINASLPPVSYTKAIDVWTGVCLTFVFGALLEFALVNYASRSDAHARIQQARQEEELRAREYEYQQRQHLAAAVAQQQQHQHQQRVQHQQQQQQQQYNVADGANFAQQKFPANEPAANGPEPNKLANGTLVQPDRGRYHWPAANGVRAPPSYKIKALDAIAARQKQYTVVGAPTTNNESLTDKQLLATQASPIFNGNANQGAKQQCEIHHAIAFQQHHQVAASNSSLGQPNKPNKHKNVNFCRAWLNKFPSRSKRIDVISRIFFPKMFALFNLVYWTTYLFREEDIVQS